MTHAASHFPTKIFRRRAYTLQLARPAQSSRTRQSHVTQIPVNINHQILFILRDDWSWIHAASETHAPHNSLHTLQHIAHAGDALLIAPNASFEIGAMTTLATNKNATNKIPTGKLVMNQESPFLLLTLAPAALLDAAVRARLVRGETAIDFRLIHVERDEKLSALAQDFARELHTEEEGLEIVIDALVEQVIIHLLRRYTTFRRSGELELSRAGLVDRRIRRSIELMHLNLERDLPLEELAAAAYLSAFHFARLFKKITGITPHAYLANLRLQAAQDLLTTTDKSITDIAQRVGFHTSSHFAKTFRLAVGLSPRDYRRAAVKIVNER